MSDETIPTSPDLSEWERNGGEATLSVIARGALGFHGAPDLGLVRGFIGDKPVAVVVAAFAEEQDPDAEGYLTTPIAVLLMGDVVDLITFPEGQGRVVANPDYVGPPVTVDA